MAAFDSDSGLPDLTDRADVLRFLERTDVPLPDGLTVEKIRSRGRWWAIDEESFGFRIERHPSGPFFGMEGMPTPARWHVRTWYTYDLTTGEWEVTEQSREFHFDAGLLVDAEFDQLPIDYMWEEAEDLETALEKFLDGIERKYRAGFEDIPEDELDEMLSVLEAEFRERAGMD
jgi:hypothetical protein